MIMKYRVTLLLNDGRQENYTADDPNYKKLDGLLNDCCIKSFVVSLNRHQD